MDVPRPQDHEDGEKDLAGSLLNMLPQTSRWQLHLGPHRNLILAWESRKWEATPTSDGNVRRKTRARPATPATRDLESASGISIVL